MLPGLPGVIAFGLTLPFTRMVTPALEPVFIGLGRAVLAGLVSAVVLIVFRAPLPNRGDILKLTGVAPGVVVGFPVLSAWAMQTVPASHGGVVLGVLPLATAFAATLVSGEKPSLAFWVAGLIGSGLVVAYSLLQGGGHFAIGDIALVAAVIAASFGYAIGGALSKRLGGWQVICWALVISLPFITLPAWLSRPPEPMALDTSIWLSFLYLALISQLIGFVFWNKGLAIGGVARVSQIQLVQPFVTLIGAALLAGEVIESNTLIFIVLIVSVVALGKRMPVIRR